MMSEALPVQPSRHVSVMPLEVIESLRAKEGGDFIDCTLGGGGHTRLILDANPVNTVLGVDRDERALRRVEKSLAQYGNRLRLMRGSFSSLSSLVAGSKFRGAIADLGVSTDQLFEERGFSFHDNSPLDMRMDESAPTSADEIINGLEEQPLYVILRQGGVGPEARAVARAIVRSRPISSAVELAQIIASTIPAQRAKKKVNPATVVFQAIRIAVNDELAEIQQLLEQAPGFVLDGGRLAVITFHSLEDKIVTSKMRSWEGSDAMPALWPGRREVHRIGKLVSRKPLVASEEEVAANPNSRSARLRVFEFSEVI